MDTALKQRLIGAAVLIALAVFFLPMLVKGPAPDSGVSGVSLDMPDAPEDGMQTRDLPLTAPGEVPKGGAVGLNATPIDRNAPPATGVLGAGQTDPAAGTAAADPAAAGEPVDPSAVADPNAAASALPAAAAGGDYAVHFGAYATAKAADTVVALAKAAQLPAYSEPATVGGKAAWRVRIGPYATRADAESARLKALEVRSDVPVRVVVLDAETAAGAAPAAPVPGPSPAPTKPAPAEAASASAVKPLEAPKPAEPKPAPPAKPAVSPVATKPAAAKPELKPESKPDPKPAAPNPVASKPATPKPAAAAPAASATAPPPAAPKPAPVNRPADSGALVAVAPKPKPAAAAPAASKVGFAVQLGAFGNPADAAALRDRLRAAGFTAFTETVSTDKGALTRVRVGPVVDRASADQLKAQVQAKTGVDGIVRSHP